MQHDVRHGQRHLSVTVQRSAAGGVFTVTVDGRPHEVHAELLDPLTLRFVIEGVPHMALVARVGDAVHVALAGAVFVFARETAATVAAHVATLANPQIVAPMPGKILQVLVRTGQELAAGDGILILEAMKMEHRMVAEAPATVRAVHVADGQMVDAGAVMVELEYGAVEDA
jgi:acetyl/propionyl-CoA carboxylase alpha subunit